MRSVAAGAFEVGLRGVQPDDRTTPLRQRRRYDTRAAADVQHPVASFDPGEIEKRTGQAAAPSRHEVLVGSRIGRQEQQGDAPSRVLFGQLAADSSPFLLMAEKKDQSSHGALPSLERDRPSEFCNDPLYTTSGRQPRSG